MNAKWLVTALLAGNGFARMIPASGISVDVWVSGDSLPVILASRAQGGVSEIFRQAGVEISWHWGQQHKHRTAADVTAPCREFAIRIVPTAAVKTPPGVLADTHPYGECGTPISVYFDRVEPLMRNNRTIGDLYLAYVFAHELGHAMERIAQHSPEGIMRANWSDEEFALMRQRRLAFAESDLRFIRRGLEEPVSLLAVRENGHGK